MPAGQFSVHISHVVQVFRLSRASKSALFSSDNLLTTSMRPLALPDSHPVSSKTGHTDLQVPHLTHFRMDLISSFASEFFKISQVHFAWI